MFRVLFDLLAVLKDILKQLKLRKPGLMFFVVIEQENGMLKGKLVLPPPGASDVVSRNLTYQIGDKAPVKESIDASTLEWGNGIEGSDGDTLVVSLSDVDNAGNVSPAREGNFVFTDTIAPPQPGELGLVITEETDDVVIDPVDPVE